MGLCEAGRSGVGVARVSHVPVRARGGDPDFIAARTTSAAAAATVKAMGDSNRGRGEDSDDDCADLPARSPHYSQMS